MRKSLWVALILAFSLVVPVRTYASPIDSFTSGFDDLVNPKTDVVVQDPTSGYNEVYEPKVLEAPAAEVQEVGPFEGIISFFNGQRVQIGGNVYTGKNVWLGTLRTFLESSGFNAYLIVSVGLVFVWWGVRKTKSIIMHAYRTGSLNLGTSIKRAWYRRKAKEWYG